MKNSYINNNPTKCKVVKSKFDFNPKEEYNSTMNSKMISSLSRKHLPLVNSGWTCSRPQYTFAIELDSGGFGK